MIPRWVPTILIFSQAIYLAGALPRPRAQGPSEQCPDNGPTPDNVFSNPIAAANIVPAPSTTSESTSTPSTSAITLLTPNHSVTVVTSTALSTTQTPTTTSAVTQNSPDTSGTVQSTLETGGNPTSQPFATSIPSISVSTLVPLSTIAGLNNATSSSSTITQTITVPVSTFETVLSTSAVTSVLVDTTVTYTTGSSTLTITVTALSETTLAGSSTSTGTIATTITTDDSPSTVPTATSNCTCYGQNIFLPVALGQPPSSIPRQGGHPELRLGITDAGDGPIETNKFYANIFLGSQGSSIFTEPYGMMWSRGSGNAMSWGLSISHSDSSQFVFGPPNTQIPNTPNSYYINPIGIQSIVMSAAELGSSTVMTSNSNLVFSSNIVLSPLNGSSSSITFPVVQGMAFVSAVYDNLQPAIQSSVFFRNVVAAGSPKPGIYKYRATLEDGNIWLIYAVPNDGLTPNFQLISSTLLQGLPSFSGLIQVAKNPVADDTLYDNAAGTYPTSGSISGYANGDAASYSLAWTKGGVFASNTTLLMFALPHHVESFDNTTSAFVNNSLTLQTTTKGLATAVIADAWTLMEELPTSMGFAPWRPGGSNVTTLSSAAIAAIQNVSAVEASQNMSAQSNLNSMYYSGKALSKFATIVYTMNDLAEQQGLAAAALVELEEAFAIFAKNQQQFPLLYDTDWKGVVSSASYVTGDSGVDFGNSYYNDHHFHYAYFIHAAAIIGYLDPSWLTENQDYVNTLVRDVSNPSTQDQYFPVFRSFDWYSGHSWAKGLFESGDGKDEESSSEDAMFAYGLKMWGRTIGDASMEARGNLMLAVLARSLQNYFLMESDNVNQPAQFIGNKVTGITFQNKIDHTTYFGSNFEYIQGIHMIPLTPFSQLTRTPQFVAEEWSTYFCDHCIDPAFNVTGGWKGILYANLAIIDPTTSYNFFTQPNFDPSWLDGGASQTWYIAQAAGLGGAT